MFETAVPFPIYGKDLESTLFDPPLVLVIVATLTNLAIWEKSDDFALVRIGVIDKSKLARTSYDLSKPFSLEQPFQRGKNP
jgi:hypothetical protein